MRAAPASRQADRAGKFSPCRPRVPAAAPPRVQSSRGPPADEGIVHVLTQEWDGVKHLAASGAPAALDRERGLQIDVVPVDLAKNGQRLNPRQQGELLDHALRAG